jgi:thermostable 8-oxoguanine DNA glycosylase
MKNRSTKPLVKLKDIISDLPKLTEKAKNEYIYQEKLTADLDKLDGPLTYTNLLEIMLWKVNRYPQLEENTLNELNDLKMNYSDEKAKIVLENLLKCKGIDLPVASTILRFTDPNKFQILDQRVFRFIYDDEELKTPFNIKKKVELYFEYLAKLRHICKSYNIDFHTADRILYQIDKIENKNIPIKY